MGFWIYIFIMNMLIPVTMIGFGRYFMKHTPKEINHVFGYRTSMSMKNRDTWDFAHKYCGRLYWHFGLFMLPLSVTPMLFILNRDTNTVGTVGAIETTIQIIFLLVPVILTERALKRNFDKYGYRR